MKDLTLVTILIALFTFSVLTGCGKGPAGANGTDGRNGTDGANGVNGTNGTNGHNSLVSIVSSAPTCTNGGVTILAGLDSDNDGLLEGSEVTSSAQVCNGTNGKDGVNTFTSVSVIYPCGKHGSYNEVLLNLGNGVVLASFSDNPSGKNTRFSVLSPGTYETTDGINCIFTLNSDGTIVDD